MVVLNFITTYILQNPPVLLGLVAMIGLIVQKKGFAEIVKDTLLAAFGMLILTTGVNMLSGTISPINAAFQSLVNAGAGKGLNSDTFTSSFGGDVGMAMFIALILHVLIARFTPIKTIFLTGHMLWWFPFIFVAAGVEAGLRGAILVGASAVFSAVYWSVMPWLLKKYVFAATGDTSFTIGHPTGFLSLISGFVASKVGNKEKSTEDLKLPKGLSFFREISITGAAVIFIVSVIVAIWIPSSIAKGTNFFMEAVNQGLTFGGGLIILLSGVRLLIGQIIPAFQGISEKLVPDALPAFDCPVIFNYKPNAVLIGFITAMVTSTILVSISDAVHLFPIMLIPLVITSFFECGCAAVIGEGQGGVRGCIIGTACAAVVMVALVGISSMIYTHTILNFNLVFGGNDLSLFGIISFLIDKVIHLL